METYDYIIAPFECPYCGYEEEEYEWQTDALHNLLYSTKVGEQIISDGLVIYDGEIEIQTICEGCGEFVRCWIKIRDGKLTDEISCEPNDVDHEYEGFEVSGRFADELKRMMEKREPRE
ncbi:hypothetical protein [Archaeoglobus veneficus]|uniref:Uncharacterized protein n=1 Tax=Archaeoglobus veneficus (strain DSM 11195 / SNP6) TaxID=693661 RepID=F2KMQ0_ARCVS|nr:hypothetical protein [Archaeoglobus veneficus]AEA46074.1 hypothetical protein Arcve_0031 [Archaeoglobus veneficus SNP6]